MRGMAEGGESIPKSLACPICHDIFDKATLLGCGHTFCQRCLLTLDQIKKKTSHMNCPVCREATVLHEKRVEGLARNITVNALVEDFLQEKLSLTPSPEPPPEPNRINEAENASYAGYCVSHVDEPLTVLREIDLPAGMRGIAALCQDSVVVGYGSSMPGADCFTTTGYKRTYLPRSVGAVRDLTILTDRSTVVSHGADNIRVYDKNGTQMNKCFDSRKSNNNQYKLCSDRLNNIYAVNKNSEIYVFKPGQVMPRRVIQTRSLKPWQICTTSMGALIISSYNKSLGSTSTVTLFDREGNEGTSIKATENNEFLYATVDSKDNVFIASIRPMIGSFRLSMYGAEEQHLVKKAEYKELQLNPTKTIWFYMVCLTPELLALASIENRLYFIRVPSK